VGIAMSALGGSGRLPWHWPLHSGPGEKGSVHRGNERSRCPPAAAWPTDGGDM